MGLVMKKVILAALPVLTVLLGAGPVMAVDWAINGNGISSGDWLGSNNAQSVDFKVNSARALRLDYSGGTPNVIGGYSTNGVTGGVVGAFVGGGGDSFTPNGVTDDYSVVCGGANNFAGNQDGTTTNATYAALVGGANNQALGAQSFIGGGDSNTTAGENSVVGGGYGNYATYTCATIGGGYENGTGASYWYQTIGGGYRNSTSSTASTIAGGYDNTASGSYSTVAGGSTNTASGSSATVCGGVSNTASGNVSVQGSYAAAASGMTWSRPGRSDGAAWPRSEASTA
jgi:hypothetical protein